MFGLLFLIAIIVTIVVLSRKVLHLREVLTNVQLDNRFGDAYRHTSDAREALERKLEENVKYLESNHQMTIDALDLRLSEKLAELDRKIDENVAELHRRDSTVADEFDHRLDAVIDDLVELQQAKSKK